MKMLKTMLVTLAVTMSGSVFAMDNQGGYDPKQLEKMIVLSHGSDSQPQPDVQFAASTRPVVLETPVSPRTDVIQRAPDATPSILRPLVVSQQQIQPYQGPSGMQQVLSFVNDEGAELGKSVLYLGTRSLCDLGLRYIQRHTFSESLKAWWLVRLGCLYIRASMSEGVLNAVSPNYVGSPKGTNTLFEKLNVKVGVWYAIERSIGRQPSAIDVLLKYFNIISV